jgi:hypothetical protein
MAVPFSSDRDQDLDTVTAVVARPACPSMKLLDPPAHRRPGCRPARPGLGQRFRAACARWPQR